MAHFHSLLSSVLAAFVLARSVAASSDLRDYDTRSTNGVVTLSRRGVELEVYYPSTTYEIYEEGTERPNSRASSNNNLVDDARQFVASKLNIDADTVEISSEYTSDIGTRHVYLRQIFNGIAVSNAAASVILKDGKVVSFSSSFITPPALSSSRSSRPSVDLEPHLSSVEEQLDAKSLGKPTRLEYVAKGDGSLSLAHVIQVGNESTGQFLEAFVDASNGELVAATNLASHLTYRALPFNKQQFPDGVELIVNPEDLVSSPQGWTHLSGLNTSSTSGNNAIAFFSSPSVTTPPSPSGPSLQSSAGVFDYIYDDNLAPSVSQNLNAARTNAFYVANKFHDVMYRYGFTESAGNFQQDNFGKGGVGGDRLLISVQDPGRNGGFCYTPADGQSQECYIYPWDVTTPGRDGSLSNDILIHEFTHGLTNRLTGGASNPNCLQTLENLGLREGSSDALAEWAQWKDATVTDFVLSTWVNTQGVRTYPYSTSLSTNPLLYSDIRRNLTPWTAHAQGEVWANILHNVYANLVTARGFSSDALTNPAGTGGNTIWLHFFVDSFMLMPCNPTYLNARDAWIQADALRYGGANKCLIWRAFASRGMGVNAVPYTNDYAVPAGC
ncbi:metalloprotease [Coprinopsis sp. MPI-PUGE-AT-0042]|nr:metalloprotease [Coprinopsis sp. MPI-PUGE-AT-0042]